MAVNDDPNYQRLAKKHQEYEERLATLQSRRFPSPEEQAEETTLKKLKLHVKDQMEEILRHAAAGASSSK